MDNIEARITSALQEVSHDAPNINEIAIPERRRRGPLLWLTAAATALAAILVPLAIITQSQNGERPSAGGASRPSPPTPSRPRPRSTARPTFRPAEPASCRGR